MLSAQDGCKQTFFTSNFKPARPDRSGIQSARRVGDAQHLVAIGENLAEDCYRRCLMVGTESNQSSTFQ